jgi:hypothetical protein
MFTGCDAMSADAEQEKRADTAPRLVTRAELMKIATPREQQLFLAACYPNTEEAENLKYFPPSKYLKYPQDVRELIRQADIERGICRGYPTPDTLRACNRAQPIGIELIERGWCFDSDEQATWAKHWRRCTGDDLKGVRSYDPPFSEEDLKEWAEQFPVPTKKELESWAKRCDEFRD